MTPFDEALAARPFDPSEQAAARARFRRRLISDKTIGGLAVRAGIAIESIYLNSKTGLAWPSLSTIANDIGCQRRAAITAVDELVGSGHLLKQSGGGNAVNRYTLSWDVLVHDDAPVSNDAPVHDETLDRCSSMHGGGVHPCTGVVSNGAPEPLEENLSIEPVEEPVEAPPAKAPTAKKQSGGKRRCRIPTDWQPTQADIAYAVSSGFPVEEVGGMANEFQNFWLGDGGVKADWSATWRNNVDRKAAWRRDKPAGKPASGVSGLAAVNAVFSGIKEGQR